VVAEATERSIRVYVTPEGRAPFEEWLASLRDKRAKARILARIDRVRLGNFGDCRSVGGGVHELRVDYGPGYRVYFGLIGTTVVLLLCGGTKKTQARDIAAAQQYWTEYKDNADEELR
jgi:putative addiction module killer protein